MLKCLNVIFLCFLTHSISASILRTVLSDVGSISYQVLSVTNLTNQVLNVTNLNQVLNVTNLNQVISTANQVLDITNLDPEVNMNTIQLIQHWGFQAEAYDVTTKDGYIIQIHRIIGKQTGNKTPVLLQHALLCSSADWVINLRNQSLGFLLADANYDVWLGNVRGNTYGLRHISLSPNDAAFWKFSWDEMAAYDVPAIIDYILNTTGHQEIYYVGHSMGTTMGFAMLASKTEYNTKVKAMFALAPVVSMAHFRQELFKAASQNYKDIQLVLELFDVKAFLANTPLIKFIAVTLCHNPVTSYICADFIGYIVGNDPPELNKTRLPVYITHTPAGTSVQTLVHYAQNIYTKLWQYYDYGSSKNLEKYGSINPPLYEVKNVTSPVFLFHSLNDAYADTEDVQWLADNLPNLIESYQIEDAQWNHLDFSWGIHAAPYIYEKIINYLNLHEQ